MSDRRAIYQRVSTAAWDSGRWVLTFDALENRSFQAVRPLVRGYVRDKFLLSEEDGDSPEIMGLADLSLRKILRYKKEGKLLGDISRGCSGASSVITKKVLLMKAVQEDFGITLTPQQAAAIQTLDELTAAILEQRTDGNGHNSGRAGTAESGI